jgi:hypothetical protein
LPIMSVREKLEQDRFRIEFAAKEKLEIVLSAPVPAFTHEFRSVGPSQFRSDIFKQTPPVITLHRKDPLEYGVIPLTHILFLPYFPLLCAC